MKYDILLCGVGGQGVLSIATVIASSAMAEGFYVRQSEVHGMSQRGGGVHAHLRISDVSIASDLIPSGDGIKARFSKKDPRLVDINIKALQLGENYK